MPASRPNCSSLRPNSLFMVNAAKPIFTRSRNATIYSRKINGRMRNWILRTAVLAASEVPGFGRALMRLDRLQVRVAFDELFCAAPGETHGDAAIVVFPFHADHRSHAVLRMAHLLAQQRVSLSSAHDGRSAEGVRGSGTPL